MTCLGVLDRGKRANDNGTSLKEGGLIEMSTTVLQCSIRDARSLSLKILTFASYRLCRAVRCKTTTFTVHNTATNAATYTAAAVRGFHAAIVQF